MVGVGGEGAEVAVGYNFISSWFAQELKPPACFLSSPLGGAVVVEVVTADWGVVGELGALARQ